VPGPLTSVAFALLVAAHAATAEDPREIVRRALRAVEGDSARAVAVRWQGALRRDSTDRAAALGLATLARLTYDYPTAERLYQRLVAAGTGSRDRYAVYARLGLAQGLEAQGRVGGLDTLLARARGDARALGDRTAEGEALLWLGTLPKSALSVEARAALLDSALRLLPEDARDLRVECRCRRAQMLVILGHPESTTELNAALESSRRAGEARAGAYCLRALALDRNLHQDLDSAIAVYRSVEDLWRRVRDRSGQAKALVWRADVLRKRGSHGEAMEVLHRAVAEAQASHNLSVLASAKIILGALFYALQDYAAAAEHVDQAIAALAAQGDSANLALGWKWRADIDAAVGDFAGARRELVQALDFFRRQEEVAWQAQVYQGLADIAIREGDWAAAERALDSAGALMRGHIGRAWAAEQPYERGRLALYRGDLAAAERDFTRYLDRPGSGDHLSRYETRSRLAEVYARRGVLDRAERELRLAGDELDAWRASLTDRDLRVLAFQASGADEHDRNASMARVLALLAQGGRAEAAFALAERRRARELVDRMARAEALRTRAVKPPRGDSAPPNPGPVSATELAAAIPDDRTAVVEYVTGDFGAPTTLFILTRAGQRGGNAVDSAGGGSVRARVLPPADSLAENIALFATLLESGADPRPLAQALGAALLDPATAALGPAVTRLVIVPDGALHRLPFDALRLADGRYAAERYAVSVAPSAGALAALWRRAREHGSAAERPLRVLAFGDPVFPGERVAVGQAAHESTADEVYRSAFTAAGGLPRLRASADEARLAARYAPHSEVRLRERASAAYLKHAALDSFRVIHFATHALVDETSVARTALALAPGGGESGFVGAGDLAALRLDADLVVLSACRTASGVVVGGEGVQGLTAPLLAAGARSVVATRWNVGDRSTVAFAQDFYAAVARGLAVGEALRAAKLAALRRGAPPRTWAAFTLVGDPFVGVPLRAPPPFSRWWPARLALGVACALAGAALAYGVRTRGWRVWARRSTRPVS